MLRGGGFPYFLWQEYNENWETLSFDKVTALNKAASKDQKRVTLSCSDTRKRSTIYFQKMLSKNKTVEKPVRCLILINKSKYAIWNINEDDNFMYFPPRMTYFLELMFLKEQPKVNFYYKTEYEMDFSQFVLTNKNTGILYSIQREETVIRPSWNKAEMKTHAHNIAFSKSLMENFSIFTVDRLKNLLFNISVAGTEVSPTLPLPRQWISILNKDVTSKDCTLMPVDPFCSLNESIEHNVVSENGHSFSASLVLTNIDENINKFYILQLLKLKSKKIYVVYARSGRVGYIGSEEFSEMFSYLKSAKEEFKARFYEKTQNVWSERHSFQRKQNKYDFLDTYFNSANTMDECFNPSLEYIISTLDKTLQDLLLLVMENDEAKLKRFVKNWLLKFVPEKMGIPTSKQLAKSFTALNELSGMLSKCNKGKDLIEACNNYYMKMPHATNYNAPKTILCAEDIENEVLMLQTLAYTFLNDSEAHISVENPIKQHLRNLQWNLTYLDHRSPEFTILQQSVLCLHGPTHLYKMDLLDAYKWHQQAELERFVDKGGKMLLWHGTQVSSFLGIIKNGLKLPPKDSPDKSMFGRGLYFADVSSKSANYCLPTKKNDVKLLLLCEVSMGIPLEVSRDGDYSTHPNLFGGVIYLGEYYPTKFEVSILAPGAVIPQGPLKKRNGKHITLKYNEYVIYDERQVKIRYLLKVKFSSI